MWRFGEPSVRHLSRASQRTAAETCLNLNISVVLRSSAPEPEDRSGAHLGLMEFHKYSLYLARLFNIGIMARVGATVRPEAEGRTTWRP
jgi:hypothetical protein